MKKVLQILAAVGFGVIALTTTASAQQQNCQLENTGPSSVNVCTNVNEVACTVENNNTITIGNTNYQVSETGEATVTGNTNGGGSNSGSSNNSSSTSVNIVVNNQDDVEGQFCTVTTTTRTPVETPGVGGAGAGAATVAAPTVLPKTSSSSPLVIAATALAAIVALAFVSRATLLAVARKN